MSKDQNELTVRVRADADGNRSFGRDLFRDLLKGPDLSAPIRESMDKLGKSLSESTRAGIGSTNWPAIGPTIEQRQYETLQLMLRQMEAQDRRERWTLALAGIAAVTGIAGAIAGIAVAI
jgi:hypothetical protein